MADWGQFDRKTAELEREAAVEQPAACQVCEAMLPDAVDGVLSEAEQRAFDRHVAGCVVCARELEEAQRGAAWLHMLKQQSPEPSAALLERILAQAPGAQAAGASVASYVPAANEPLAASPVPAGAFLPKFENELRPVVAARPRVRAVSAWQAVREGFSLQWMRPMLQPRMAMTAAMAFFSIALTLNLTGVRLNDLSMASLRPSSLRRAVADRSTAAVRSFQNMRVVYQAEAQVNDLRSNWRAQEDDRTPAAPAPEDSKPKQQDSDKPQNPEKPQGSSELDITPLGPQQNAGMARKGA